MSLDKAIKHGKEHRKPFKGSARFDKGCRNHGPCSYCADNRCHKHKRSDKKIDLDEVFEDIHENKL